MIHPLSELFCRIKDRTLSPEDLEQQKQDCMNSAKLSEQDFACLRLFAAIVTHRRRDDFLALEAIARGRNPIAAGIVAYLYFFGEFGADKDPGVGYRLLRAMDFDGSRFPLIFTLHADALAAGIIRGAGDGRHVIKNPGEAGRLYARAAQADCALGYLRYGVCLCKGICGITKDIARGLFYRIKATRMFTETDWAKLRTSSEATQLVRLLDEDSDTRHCLNELDFASVISSINKSPPLEARLLVQDPKSQARFIHNAVSRISEIMFYDIPDRVKAKCVMDISQEILSCTHSVAQGDFLIAHGAYRLLELGASDLLAEQHAWLLDQLMYSPTLAKLIQSQFGEYKNEGQERLRDFILYHYQQYAKKSEKDDYYSAVHNLFTKRGAARAEDYFGVAALSSDKPTTASQLRLEQKQSSPEMGSLDEDEEEPPITYHARALALNEPQKIGFLPVPRVNLNCRPTKEHFVPYWCLRLTDIAQQNKQLAPICQAMRPLLVFFSAAQLITNFKVCEFSYQAMSTLIAYHDERGFDIASLRGVLHEAVVALIPVLPGSSQLWDLLSDLLSTVYAQKVNLNHCPVKHWPERLFLSFHKAMLNELTNRFTDPHLKAMCAKVSTLCDLADSPLLGKNQQEKARNVVRILYVALDRCEEGTRASILALQQKCQQTIAQAEPVLSEVSTIWYVLSGILQILISLTGVGLYFVALWREQKRAGSSSPVFFSNTAVDNALDDIAQCATARLVASNSSAS